MFQLLEANMRLKLSGPDYKDKDPQKSLEDFKKRVEAYESAYEPLGEYEEKRDLQYVQVCGRGLLSPSARPGPELTSGKDHRCGQESRLPPPQGLPEWRHCLLSDYVQPVPAADMDYPAWTEYG